MNRPPSQSPIRLVVTDVDGTLVRHDKTMSPTTIAAAHALRAADIRLALVSSRPPRGLDVLIEPLGLDTPRAGFNGASILSPRDETLEDLLIAEAAARTAIEGMEAAGIDVWVFAEGKWFLKNEHARYIPREKLSINMDWEVVDDFTPYIAHTHKIMGSSPDFGLVATTAATLAKRIGSAATVLRSQAYYIDVTHPRANKGQAALELARLLRVPPDSLACIGDMPNDIPMFEVSALSIAMGNGPDEVKEKADEVVGSNEEKGWAEAVELILKRTPRHTA